MNKLFRQLAKYGFVGFFAAATHFSILVLLVETKMLTPIYANMIAFIIAFQVTYWGHRSLTFQGTSTLHRIAFPKLLVIGISGFAANQSLFYFFLTIIHLPYPLAYLCVLTIVPLVSFTFTKLWVFK